MVVRRRSYGGKGRDYTMHITGKNFSYISTQTATVNICNMGQTNSQSLAPDTSASHPGSPIHREGSASQCPIQLDTPIKPAQCPVEHGQLNPLNQMPTLAQAPSPNQCAPLPTSRTESSIPRDPGSKWEYPSPQQFYNALVRKGWETPEEHVETMVEIHNFLNEQAWLEVQKWEKRQYGYIPTSFDLYLKLKHPLQVLPISNSPASKADLAKCRQKREYYCLQGGFCPVASSTWFLG